MADDIAKWLEGLGLGRYAQAFAENDIDVEVLSRLTDDDLKELGLSIGHRRKLQAAVEALSSDERATRPQASPAREAEPKLAEAERRQLTVLFCDLVGSTAMSSRLDPEDMREVLRAYQDACSGVIARYDGYVAKFMGDGVYAYFGYPRAHEDDAERAITAGLGIVEAVGGLEHDLAVRIGVATGTVAVGDIVGEGASEEANVVGEAPNLAARLQEIAQPNTVVIGEATRNLAAGLFETLYLGKRDFKGFARPVSAWSAIRPGRTESRFEATRGEHLTELVGRDEEMEILRRRWERAKNGEGQLVLITGEPGIGKSRLAHELQDQTANERPTVLTAQFASHHVNSAMFPFVEQMRRAIGFEPEDTNPTRLDKLEEWVRHAKQSPDKIVPIVAPILGFDATERYPMLEVAPERRKVLLFEAFAERLSNRTAQNPVLYVVEDAHWADPTTLELLGLQFERFIGRAPILFVVTYRPEFAPPWVGQSNTTVLTLNRLDRAQSAKLVENASGGEHLQKSTVEQITQRTDGVPLFVEELTKAVLESSGEDLGTSPLDVPATLQDSLEARLDRLGQAKESAQIGAVIGREFGYELLATVAPSRLDLKVTLERLEAAELVFRLGLPPNATFTFKHALVRDTAYASLLRTTRAELHERVATAIEERWPDQTETEPEVLAHHFTRANLPEQATPYWRKAGQNALERSANNEASAHFSAALEQLEILPETSERDNLELDLRLSLGPTLMAARSYGADEVEACYDRARDLAERIKDSARLFTARFGLWQMNNFRGNVTVASHYATELIDSTEASEHSGRRLQAHHTFSTSALFLGNPLAVCEHARAGVALYDRDAHSDHKYLYGAHDPGVCGLGIDGVGSFLLGFPDRSSENAEASLDLAHELSHANTSAVAYCWLMATKYIHGDLPAVIEYGDAGNAFCEEYGLSNWQNYISLVQAAARGKLGGTDETSEISDRAERWRAAGTLNFWQWFLTLRADAQAQRGHRAEAFATIAEALDHGRRNGEVWFDAELYRLRATLLLEKSKSPTEEAEAALCLALKVARTQQAKAWELRAATELARLWGEAGRRNDASSLIAPIYDWFTEGIDTADLIEAKALLDELG